MSCTDVMYQPYASYFSYAQRHSAAAAASNTAYMDSFKKLGFQKMAGDHLDMGSYASHGGGGGLGSLGAMSAGSTGSLPSSPPINNPTPTKQETNDAASEEDKDAQPRDTQYLTENCVLITYFSGDTASNVDDHFSRALSQPATYNGSQDSQSKSDISSTSWATAASPTTTTKGGPPMSQRNFPPSFWNSHYQPPPAAVPSSLASSFDPYASYPMASSLHGHVPGFSHHQDPWARAAAAASASYPFAAASSQPHGYSSHHHLHDFTSSYGSMAAASSSRFNPQFGSFMPSKLGGLGSQYDIKPHSGPTAASGSVTGSADSWSSRYDPFSSSSHIAQATHQPDPYSLHAYTGSAAALSGTC